MPRLALLSIALAATFACRSAMTPDATAPQEDPYLWLEEVDSTRALEWVRARNASALAALARDPRHERLQQRILSILDSTDRIPYADKHGSHYFNFWQDANNPRGLLRRTTFAEYQRAAPAWETVLDLDALARTEGENWVWKGATWCRPECRRCLVSLSRGGADAVVVREFDLETKRFVDGGFVLPEAKSSVSWQGPDAIFVATDFGPGSLTNSGYPRIVKLWRRDTPLAASATIAEADLEDIGIEASRDATRGYEREFVHRATSFFTSELSVLRDGRPVRIDKPDSATATVHREWLLLELRDDWAVGGRNYRAGSLLAARFEAFLAGDRALDVLFEPSERTSLAAYSPTRDHVLLNVLDNVRNRVFVLTPGADGWQREPFAGLPEFGTISAAAVDDEEGNDCWLSITDFLTPTSLWHGTVGGGAPVRLKSLPAFFDATGLAVEQRHARSADGTEVPYFLVMRPEAARARQPQPLLLYGYGGFEVSLTPSYHTAIGAGWLEAGGAFAVANIRGGGEFGPRWHQAALRQRRHKSYEDFAAVAEDLVRLGVTSPRHLGIMGGSNGGLLVGNMLTTYPQLFRAVVCQVPLLDMLRYHRLLAGHSWIEEYGDPEDPVAAEWLRRYSPYHNIAAGRSYPRLLLLTSTRDDRVHPGHARKMAARMAALGHEVLYYENTEGGHAGAADNKQAAQMSAMAFTFLWQSLR